MCCTEKCTLIFISLVLIFLGIIIALVEVGNVLVDFWYTNVFAGFWTAPLVFNNAVVVFVHGCILNECCKTYSIIANIFSIIGLGTLIGFDIVFIINPHTCILTPTCSSRSPITSSTFMQTISIFQNYSIYDSKRLFFYIQIGCAGLALALSLIYLIAYSPCCKRKFGKSPNVVSPGPQPTPHPVPKPSDPKPKLLLRELKPLTQPPPWSISNPTTFQSFYTPPF